MSPALRISVADDETDMREYFQEMLPLMGHEVVSVAADGQELVDQCESARPDLVIADIKMPELDGIEAGMEINRRHAIPVILVSAYHEVELLERAEASHILAYLVKPG
jgi:two-component system, response regulator PdtaR